jgi:hypothetical protein
MPHLNPFWRKELRAGLTEAWQGVGQINKGLYRSITCCISESPRNRETSSGRSKRANSDNNYKPITDAIQKFRTDSCSYWCRELSSQKLGPSDAQKFKADIPKIHAKPYISWSQLMQTCDLSMSELNAYLSDYISGNFPEIRHDSNNVTEVIESKFFESAQAEAAKRLNVWCQKHNVEAQ